MPGANVFILRILPVILVFFPSSPFLLPLDLRTFEITSVSPQIYTLLGYRPDMWLNQSLVKFLASHDSLAFISHVSMMQTMFFKDVRGEDASTNCMDPLNIFCRIAPYSSLKYGFTLRGKKSPKIAFKLTCVVYPPKKRRREGRNNGVAAKDGAGEGEASAGVAPDSATSPKRRSDDDDDDGEWDESDDSELENEEELCDNSAIFILAAPIFSPYLKPYSLPGGSNREECAFFTRHDGRCLFTSVDFKVTTLLGHLPQEMTGSTIFKFLHPDDLTLLLDIHQKILGQWCLFLLGDNIVGRNRGEI